MTKQYFIIAGRWLSKWLADLGREWIREATERMPEARGDIREIVGQPVFVPLYKLYLVYGGVFRLSFGPKTFVIVSDREVAKQILVTNASQYSKGILSEILDFVMGQVCFWCLFNLHLLTPSTNFWISSTLTCRPNVVSINESHWQYILDNCICQFALTVPRYQYRCNRLTQSKLQSNLPEICPCHSNIQI